MNWDNAYNKLITDIYKHGVWSDGHVRTKYADNSPALYKSLIGYPLVLDNSTDDAFLLTTKHVAWKNSIKEMYWIYIMQSNKVKDLQDMGVRIWQNWGIPETNPEKIEYVKPMKKDIYTALPEVKINDIINTNPDKIFVSNYGPFYVLDRMPGSNYCKIQFLQTGYIKTVSKSRVREKDPAVMDPYYRSVMNVGYMGNCRSDDIKKYFGVYLERWIDIWRGIIKRCYSTKDAKVKYYGNIHVSPEFHSCEYFLRWVMSNNRFGTRHLDKLCVNKDYYKSNYYGEDSCVLLTPKENAQLTVRNFYRYDNKYLFSIRDLYKYINNKFKMMIDDDKTYRNKLINNAIHRLATLDEHSDNFIQVIPNSQDKNGLYPRFSLTSYETIGKAYGYQVNKPTFGYSNQLEYVIETIKKDPNSRRIMIDLWCPEELHEMALTPCCYNLIFNVQKDKLYMQLNIRSSDTALGLPFNVFQFQVLHKLIAHECNLKPANLIIMISNVHYYDRHEEDLLKQIKNSLYKPAKLHIDYPDSIWDFKPEMVTVEDYEHGPKISYEIAI